MPNELRVKIINGLLRDSGRSPIPAAMRTVLESSIPALATVIDQAAKHTNKANEQEQVIWGASWSDRIGVSCVPLMLLWHGECLNMHCAIDWCTLC